MEGERHPGHPKGRDTVIITLKEKDGKGLVQIRSMADGLNYQIFLRPEGVMRDGVLVNPKNGKEIKSDWIPQQIYAQDLPYALQLAVRKVLLISEGSFSINIENFTKESKKLIEKLVGDLVTEVNDG